MTTPKRAPSFRRPLFVGLGVLLLGVAPAVQALAQSKQAEDDARRKASAEADAKKKQKAKDWSLGNAPLPTQKNMGPCPFVKVLYDASRYVELKDAKEASAAVGWTGEIQNVQSTCKYRQADPISVAVNVNFALGRGPMAQGDAKTYRYFVAVTARNLKVLAKEYFELPVTFAPGADRMAASQRIDTISIPRADKFVRGDQFEVLVGFDVTPQMAEFNRQGKRFRVNAGGATEVATSGQ